MNLPTIIKLGHFNIQIKAIEPELASHNEEEGSFHSGSRTIYIDQNIIDRGGVDLVNVIIHELLHVSYYKNNLSKASTEEDLVNAFSNDFTELLSRTELLNFINADLYSLFKNFEVRKKVAS